MKLTIFTEDKFIDNRLIMYTRQLTELESLLTTKPNNEKDFGNLALLARIDDTRETIKRLLERRLVIMFEPLQKELDEACTELEEVNEYGDPEDRVEAAYRVETIERKIKSLKLRISCDNNR